MQNTASLQVDEFPALLARLPPDLDLDSLAIEHKAIRRPRKIKSGADLLRLALAHGPGGMSLRDAAGWSGAVGLASLSNPAVKYRLDQSVDFLKAIMDHLLAAKSASQPLHWAGRTIRVADGTSICQPGSKACPCEGGGHRLVRAWRLRPRDGRLFEPGTDRPQRR
jgi:hypothetical protein